MPKCRLVMAYLNLWVETGACSLTNSLETSATVSSARRYRRKLCWKSRLFMRRVWIRSRWSWLVVWGTGMSELRAARFVVCCLAENSGTRCLHWYTDEIWGQFHITFMLAAGVALWSVSKDWGELDKITSIGLNLSLANMWISYGHTAV